MKPNKIQAVIGALCGLGLLTLILFPPWQQAAEREVSYRKDIGRAFLFKPPEPVRVGCYFRGCVAAPAEYFHVLLNAKVLLQQCLTLFVVSALLALVFKSQRDRQVKSLKQPRVRLITSLLLALLVPPTGGIPFGAALAAIPMMLVRRDELWLIPVLMTGVLFTCCVLAIYGIISLIIWSRRSGKGAGSKTQNQIVT